LGAGFAVMNSTANTQKSCVHVSGFRFDTCWNGCRNELVEVIVEVEDDRFVPVMSPWGGSEVRGGLRRRGVPVGI